MKKMNYELVASARRMSWRFCGVFTLVVSMVLGGCGAAPQTGKSAATSAAAKDEAAYATTAAAAETWAAMEQEAELQAPSANQAMANSAADNGLSAQYQENYHNDGFNTEEYNYIQENGYKSVADEPLSTFSIDVDTAAYTNVRRMIQAGSEVPADAVRIEEMINYFSYDYPEPNGEAPFSVTTEYGSCPWNDKARLLMIGLKAESIDFHDRPASNFVFLLDVSGSMYDADKLPLVQKSFAMLAENLTAEDRVSIVTYAGYEAVVLSGERGNNTSVIIDALDSLEAGGSTAGAAGIQKAYELARKYYIKGGNNRVILATDGDLNVGISSEGDLVRLIEKEKESGVHLSVLGVGTGNIKDNKMEALADHGDGNYNYLDSIYEAKKVLVDEMGGTLITVAKDVKIQVEFNPQQVAGYRLVGYENRLLNKEDFNDDTVDAGEIGAGHTVTALYEIIPAEADTVLPESELKYQTSGEPVGSSELLTIAIRYKAPNGNTSKLLTCPVEADTYSERPSADMTFASAVAEFGMALRDSENKGTASYQSAIKLAESVVNEDSDSYRKEFIELAKKAFRQYD